MTDTHTIVAPDGTELYSADPDATALWLSEGILIAAQKAAKRLAEWMAYDPEDESSGVYGAAVDRHAAFDAMGDLIKKLAYDYAAASQLDYKAAQVSEHITEKIGAVAHDIVKRRLVA